MTQAAKRLEQMRANPQGDWSINDVIAVCEAAKVACTPPKRGGHYKVSHPSQPEILTIPAHRPIKPYYIKALVEFISRVHGA